MAKHTPGPWEAVCNRPPSPARTLTGSCQIVRVKRGGEWFPLALCDEAITIPMAEREANARLIAAAPELLAFAKAVAEFFEHGTPVHGSALCDDVHTFHEAARVAIGIADPPQ